MSRYYLFQSERLGFRNWETNDLPYMAEINADPQVMEYFPSVQSREHTAGFIARMQKQMAEKGYCYYAVDRLSDEQMIGFIGLSDQKFKADFTPCIDIGWRLSRATWGQGLATEGAKRCLDHGFHELGIETIFSICPVINQRSERVMQKIGMSKTMTFKHPVLKDHPSLEECVLYKIHP